MSVQIVIHLGIKFLAVLVNNYIVNVTSKHVNKLYKHSERPPQSVTHRRALDIFQKLFNRDRTVETCCSLPVKCQKKKFKSVLHNCRIKVGYLHYFSSRLLYCREIQLQMFHFLFKMDFLNYSAGLKLE